MTVLESVKAELDRLAVTGWHRDVAIALATQMDATPNASIARELRSLMSDVGSHAVAKKVERVSDDLKEQMEKRRERARAASGS